MKASIKDFEIMAPVGSRESLAAAIQAGADSIYFGIESLNMRARSASTFTVNDLREIAQICDKHGIKSYLTINTIIYDEDIALMRTIVDAAKEAGISAVIAADVAVMAYCCEVGQEVHLSTQLNISNAGALKFYARFADVVVLARELNLKQVRVIYDTIQKEQIKGPNGELVRIEMFCHGALCMAVSGKCYLSLHEMNASANRGACMQICRRAYDVKDKESDIELEVDNKYIMSPKDLKTIHFMDEMIEAGVRVFKIEGRARGPEYVRTVVECYKEAICSYLEGTFTEEKKQAWDERLKTVFNRVNEYSDIATHAVVADTTDEAVMKSLGIRNFDHVIVAIGENIQSSTLTTLILKELGVKKVTAKAQNDYHAKILNKIGADTVVHPERDMGRRIAHNVASASVLDYLELADEHSIVELKSTEKMAGQTIIELDIRAQYGINIIAIKRAKEFIVSPDPNINIEIGDILIMIGHDNDLGRFEKNISK